MIPYLGCETARDLLEPFIQPLIVKARLKGANGK